MSKTARDNAPLLTSFGRWLIRGSGGRPGYRRFINWWLPLHAGIGAAAAVLFDATLEKSGQVALIPVLGILIGLTFAWAGSAQAVMQSTTFSLIAGKHKGGLADWIHAYEAAIFVILVSAIAWGVAGMGFFDQGWLGVSSVVGYRAVKALLFALTSMAVREAWQVVKAAHWMLLSQTIVRDALEKGNDATVPETHTKER